MKESKKASFKNFAIDAEFSNGQLQSLVIQKTGKSKNITLDAQEVMELYDWIGTGILNRLGRSAVDGPVSTLATPAVSAPGGQGAVTSAPLAPGYSPLEERGRIVIVSAGDDKAVRDAARAELAKPHPCDASTVAHLPPIEKVLAAEGMKLETKDIPAQVVKFGNGSVEVA